NMKDALQNDLVRNIIAVALIGALLAACFWIVKPFLPALIWASMIVIATWPLLIIVEKKVMGRRPAAMVMMGLLILVFVIPFTLALG
ncbi:MAG: AI-2E family transporter YdiK, partial [Gammaproteobacteria bacterium]|nr:AI-2E family transporter YdiK [Gammaproteobacteria bacterium]NIO61387.1 AI-2E family transporter YdiK [Gammaproteobacteria bacterium]